MATITSEAAGGAWATGASWVGGVKPGAGDDAVIAGPITVATSEVCGIGGAAPGNALMIAAGGRLTAQAGGLLEVRGSIQVVNHRDIEIQGGGIVEVNPTDALGNYRVRIGDDHSSLSELFMNGSNAASLARFRVKAGALGTAFLDNSTFIGTGRIRGQFFVIEGFTGANNTFYPHNDVNWNMSWQDFQILNCRRFYQQADLRVFSNFTLQRGNFTGGVDNDDVRFRGSTAKDPSTTRLVDDVVFGKGADFAAGIADITFQDSSFWTDPVFPNTVSAQPAAFIRCLVRQVGQAAVKMPEWTDLIWIHDYTGVNPHGPRPSDGGMSAGSHEFAGLFYEYAGAAQTGDMIIPSTAGNATGVAWNFRRVIVAPNDDGGIPGVSFSFGGELDTTALVDHATVPALFSLEGVALRVGEGYPGHANMVEFKNSIIFNPNGHASSSGLKVHQLTSAGSINDVVPAADCHHNVGSGLAAGAHGGGYNQLLSAGVPGANDIDEDPLFVDTAWRKMATFDAAMGGAGTRANGLTEWFKRHRFDVAWNANYTATNFWAHILAGYSVQNPNLEDSGDDLVTRGAAPFVLPPGSDLEAGTITPANLTLLLEGTAIVGGVAPVAAKWHHSTIKGFVPGAGTELPGETNPLQAVHDNLDPDVSHYYRRELTDSDSPPVTVYSPEIEVLPGRGGSAGSRQLPRS